jgi:glutathione synthase/RimK-type ligase-like ATP-grasp enzyme
MLEIAYSGKSRPSAELIAEQGDDINIVRASRRQTDINWGRESANSELNPDITNVTNKRYMRELFAESNVPAPRLMDEAGALQAVLNGEVVIGRPDRHTKGRGFWRCESPVDVKRAMEGTRRKKAATHFIAFVDAPREYRVHIFRNKSIRISEKVFIDESKKEYTTGKPGDIKLAQVREAAKQAVLAVGLDFGAVDILASGSDNSEVFVLEVNAAPGLGGTMPKLYADTFRKWKAGEWDD